MAKLTLLQPEQAYMIDVYESESAGYTLYDSPNIIILARIVRISASCPRGLGFGCGYQSWKPRMRICRSSNHVNSIVEDLQ